MGAGDTPPPAPAPAVDAPGLAHLEMHAGAPEDPTCTPGLNAGRVAPDPAAGISTEEAFHLRPIPAPANLTLVDELPTREVTFRTIDTPEPVAPPVRRQEQAPKATTGGSRAPPLRVQGRNRDKVIGDEVVDHLTFKMRVRQAAQALTEEQPEGFREEEVTRLIHPKVLADATVRLAVRNELKKLRDADAIRSVGRGLMAGTPKLAAAATSISSETHAKLEAAMRENGGWLRRKVVLGLGGESFETALRVSRSTVDRAVARSSTFIRPWPGMFALGADERAKLVLEGSKVEYEVRLLLRGAHADVNLDPDGPLEWDEPLPEVTGDLTDPDRPAQRDLRLAEEQRRARAEADRARAVNPAAELRAMLEGRVFESVGHLAAILRDGLEPRRTAAQVLAEHGVANALETCLMGAEGRGLVSLDRWLELKEEHGREAALLTVYEAFENGEAWAHRPLRSRFYHMLAAALNVHPVGFSRGVAQAALLDEDAPLLPRMGAKTSRHRANQRAAEKRKWGEYD